MRLGMWAVGAGLLLSACSIEATTSPDGPDDVVVAEGLRFEAKTVVLESFPVQLRTSVEVTNPGERERETAFSDGCVVMLRAYRSAARTGEPAWDQARQYGCTQAIVPLRLGPGESQSYSAPQASARDVLGDSLPNGRYWLAAVVRPTGGPLLLPAGEVELAR